VATESGVAEAAVAELVVAPKASATA
jgi:hypothetical protein